MTGHEFSYMITLIRWNLWNNLSIFQIVVNAVFTVHDWKGTVQGVTYKNHFCHCKQLYYQRLEYLLYIYYYIYLLLCIYYIYLFIRWYLLCMHWRLFIPAIFTREDICVVMVIDLLNVAVFINVAVFYERGGFSSRECFL